MPVTLPQISRRAFMRRLAVAAVAPAAFPEGYAGWFGRKRDKHTFVFLSDSHVADDEALLHAGVNMANNLAACVREITANPLAPAAVIVNGDLAFANGQAGDYLTFGRLIAPVRALAPLHLLLGNHDERDHFWQAFPHDVARLKGVPQKQVAVFPTERANWFLLDSLDVTAKTPGHLGAAQLEWLGRELAARPGKPAIVVAHHPLDPTGAMGLKDSAALENLFVRHRQIKAFIFGHTHNWLITQHDSGVHLINLPPTAYVFAAGRPSGWVRTTLGTDGMEIELRALDVNHPEHAQVQRLNWRTG